MAMFSLFLTALLVSSAAANLRKGAATEAGVRPASLISDGNPVNCDNELRFDIVCNGDCNFTSHPGTCESEMFWYHGGPCSGTSTSRASSSDTAANCVDMNGGPPSTLGERVYAVISDPNDPTFVSEMWTEVGGYFWTDYRDYPTGTAGLADIQNITLYSSNETSYENMLQTMLYYAPCELDTQLDALDATQSVQLIGTAIDPKIRADINLQIKSLTTAQWQLQKITMASSVQPTFQELIISDLTSTTTLGSTTIPHIVEVNQNDTLTLLGTATAVTSTGLECSVSATYSSAA